MYEGRAPIFIGRGRKSLVPVPHLVTLIEANVNNQYQGTEVISD